MSQFYALFRSSAKGVCQFFRIIVRSQLIISTGMIFFLTIQVPLEALNLKLSDQPSHPRIILTPEKINAIKELAQTDELLSNLVDVVQLYADSALNQELIQYKFDAPGNPRLKDQRRWAMFRVYNLALTWHLTGEIKYAEKARDHLLAAAAFSDWGPSHFLNVGEISAFMGIGYDWLYEMLTPAERETISQAIIRLGLREGVKAYQGTHSESWWVNSDNNWNQVCNAGLTIAALSVAREWPDSSDYLISRAVASIPKAMQGYKPDGAWYEGPTYWAYGTTYNALMLDALQSSRDTLYGLEKDSGYLTMGKSGLYHIQTAGPTGLYFNYGDAKSTLYFSPVLFWLSHQFNQPVYAWFERLLCEKDHDRMLSGDLMNDDTLDRFLAFLVIWYSDKGQSTTYNDLSFDTKFTSTGVSLAAMRNGWDDNSMYIATKAGENNISHAHMDIGSFVLDAKGERWALDLGGDNYELPGYFDLGGPRWNYFRLNNFGHNTLVMDNAKQNPNAKTTISKFTSSSNFASVTLNISNAYIDQSYGTTRIFEFVNREHIVITDEFLPREENMSVRWGMITPAAVEIMGPEAVLTQNGKQIKLTILEPLDAAFDTISTRPTDTRQATNEGTRMLVANVTGGPAGYISTLRIEINPADTTFSQVAVANIAKPGTDADFVIFPNPMGNSSTISFHLPQRTETVARIYDLSGRMVHELFNHELEPGQHRMNWNGTDFNGMRLNEGIYLISITTGNSRISKKLIIKN